MEIVTTDMVENVENSFKIMNEHLENSNIILENNSGTSKNYFCMRFTSLLPTLILPYLSKNNNLR